MSVLPGLRAQLLHTVKFLSFLFFFFFVFLFFIYLFYFFRFVLFCNAADCILVVFSHGFSVGRSPDSVKDPT